MQTDIANSRGSFRSRTQFMLFRVGSFLYRKMQQFFGYSDFLFEWGQTKNYIKDKQRAELCVWTLESDVRGEHAN